MVTFAAMEECVIATLSKQKVMMLEKRFYQIRDSLMKVRVSLLEGSANEFDFYRYLPPRDQPLPEHTRELIRKKFKYTFKLFVQRVKTNSSKEIETLNKIQEMLTLRQFKQYELNDFKIDADITSDDQDLIKNTLIPIADIIKTRTENFQAFQKQHPKLFIDYYRKKAVKSGAFISSSNAHQNNSNSNNQSYLTIHNQSFGASNLAPSKPHSHQQSRGGGEANDLQADSDSNLHKQGLLNKHANMISQNNQAQLNNFTNISVKITNLLEYQNAKISSMIEDFKKEQDEIESFTLLNQLH